MSKKLSHKLSVFAVAMLNIGIVMNLRGLPMMAKAGTTMLFYAKGHKKANYFNGWMNCAKKIFEYTFLMYIIFCHEIFQI